MDDMSDHSKSSDKRLTDDFSLATFSDIVPSLAMNTTCPSFEDRPSSLTLQSASKKNFASDNLALTTLSYPDLITSISLGNVLLTEMKYGMPSSPRSFSIKKD